VSWHPEIVVDRELALELLGQFDELEVESLVPLSEGWDRTVWVVNDRWAFGFPRRAVVVPGMERELEYLPRLAPLLPLPITCPVFVGRPSPAFPWPFFGSELLPGVELGDAGLDEDGRTRLAVDLAQFLARLHSPEVAAAIDAESLPVDGNRRADTTVRVPKARASLAKVAEAGIWHVPAGLAALLDEAERLPTLPEPMAVAHGDLHFRHLLVQEGRASGVIDWVDICRSDPAVDLALLWMSFPAAGRKAFLATYGDVRDDQLLRARVIALSLCADLALYARANALTSLERETVAGLDRASGSAPHCS
jgi:aminoglycoside phosphotransferase (APT) family kinase protein